jgi:hypothetical protein
MERRQNENSSELCVLCGEEVDLLEPSAHARVKGRTLCRQCSQRLGGAYNPELEVWTREPELPESLTPPRED